MADKEQHDKGDGAIIVARIGLIGALITALITALASVASAYIQRPRATTPLSSYPTPSQPVSGVQAGIVTPIIIPIDYSIASGNTPATTRRLQLNYFQLDGDKLTLVMEIDNTFHILHIRTCDWPKLRKSSQGELQLVDYGGFFVRLDTDCPIERNLLVASKEKLTGWLTYRIDPKTFNVSGLYTLDKLEGFPTTVFEIK
jgi:hypothetical protein